MNLDKHQPKAACRYVDTFKNIRDSARKNKFSKIWMISAGVGDICSDAMTFSAKPRTIIHPKPKWRENGPKIRCPSTWRRSHGPSSMLSDCSFSLNPIISPTNGAGAQRRSVALTVCCHLVSRFTVCYSTVSIRNTLQRCQQCLYYSSPHIQLLEICQV